MQVQENKIILSEIICPPFQYFHKIQLFWEGHKKFRNLPRGFDFYLVNVKTIRRMAQTFVVFSEKPNFMSDKIQIFNGF